MRKIFLIFTLSLFVFSFISCSEHSTNQNQRELLFNDDWKFVKDVGDISLDELLNSDGDLGWERISLPHSANIEPLVIKERQWQGDAYYKKSFFVDESLLGRHLALNFEGAMQVADVYVNGNHALTHYGGYLPFYVDLTQLLNYGSTNTILVKLNNEDNPQVPPGKPIDQLDFNIFSGIYRNVWFVNKDQLHITDAVAANRVAGGGVMVRYCDVSESSALVDVVVDVENLHTEEVSAGVAVELISPEGNIVVSGENLSTVIKSGDYTTFSFELKVNSPKLWSPDSPSLYTLKVSVKRDGIIVDQAQERIGIKTFQFNAKGFELNGTPLYLRGTNRHQEYPYVGYALSDNANYRDAYKIKQAGFNFVRLSHYPHSKSFMDACDELGLLTMDAIPGWQFVGDSLFQARSIQDVRDMVRRDRNHASVVLWEASLNESPMPIEFMQRAHNAVHEELPTGDVYTCGWVDEVYDVYDPARQHGKPPHYWNLYDKDKAILIAEYGDWEYYAHNAGFNQTAFKDLTSEERNSRQLRGFGQKRLAQQALNYQEAHNSNLKGHAAGDANWLMYDYNRGYAPDLEASGIMDIFRLPKFAFYFYKSQADADVTSTDLFRKPIVEIANYYNDPSFLQVKIFSNCDEVELFRNGASLGRQLPDKDALSTHLNHPPFTFTLNNFIPGELMAKGYVNQKEVAKSIQKTPGQPKALKIDVDISGRPLQGGVNDIVFIYGSVVDAQGVVVPNVTNNINFELTGDGALIGSNPISAEAGIATILLRAGRKGEVTIRASSNGLQADPLTIKIEN